MQLLRFLDETKGNSRRSEAGGTGDERLSANNNADRLASEERGDASKRRRRADPPGAVGRALRTVYDDTLREEVPNDFLDLLGKLS